MQVRRTGAWRKRLVWVASLPLLALMISLQSGCRAEENWPLWQHYRTRFLDSSGRIIDHSAGDRTTSEGQAYGMFFALVANDRKSFESMLRWTADNLAGGDLTARLLAWNWGKTDSGDWKQLDTNSAADADLWLAYDCLEAGRLWQDDRLSKLGAVLADRIAHSDVVNVPSVGTVLLPGPAGFHPTPGTWVLNPSYMPPQLIARMRQQDPEGPWATVQQDLRGVLPQSAAGGFAMDWVVASSAGVHPSPAPQLLAEGKQDAPVIGGYEAIRVYLWLGIADPGTPLVRETLAALPGMARYVGTAVTPPAQMTSTGTPLDANSPVGFSAAIYPYLVALGKPREAAAQMNRVGASLDSSNGLYGRSADYYDQNLVMFGTGWKEGRYRFDRDGQLKPKWK